MATMLRNWLRLMTGNGCVARHVLPERRAAFHGRVERLEARTVLSASIGALPTLFEPPGVADDASQRSALEVEHAASYAPEFQPRLGEPQFGGPSSSGYRADANLGSLALSPRPPAPHLGFFGIGELRPPIYMVVIYVEMPGPMEISHFPEQSQPEVSPPAGYTRGPQFATSASPQTPVDPPQSVASDRTTLPTALPTVSTAATYRPPAPAPMRDFVSLGVYAPIAFTGSLPSVPVSKLSQAGARDAVLQEFSTDELLLTANRAAREIVNSENIDTEVVDHRQPASERTAGGDDLNLLDENSLSAREVKRQRNAIDEVLSRLHELPASNEALTTAPAQFRQRKQVTAEGNDAQDMLAAAPATNQPTTTDGDEGGMVWQRSTEDPTGVELGMAGDAAEQSLIHRLWAGDESNLSIGTYQAFDVATGEAAAADRSEAAPEPVDPREQIDSGSKVSNEEQPAPARNAAAWLGFAAIVGVAKRRGDKKSGPFNNSF